jgi:hypothetical protein
VSHYKFGRGGRSAFAGIAVLERAFAARPAQMAEIEGLMDQYEPPDWLGDRVVTPENLHWLVSPCARLSPAQSYATQCLAAGGASLREIQERLMYGASSVRRRPRSYGRTHEALCSAASRLDTPVSNPTPKGNHYGIYR